MKKHLLLPLFFLAALGLYAASAKTYQVTGNVTALTDTMITLVKGEEKFEIDRASGTKIDGKLAVGSKVTVYYTMEATKVEVKDAPAAKATDKADAAAAKAAKKAK